MLFGDPITDAATIARRIGARIACEVPLREDGRDFVPKNAVWTTAIRKILRDLGSELGVETRHELAEMGTEKLFDIIWLGERRRLQLTAEGEWKQSPSEIEYDFQKLLYAKSPLKLMIYAGLNPEILPKLKQTLVEYGGHIEGEEHIIIQISEMKRKGRPRRLHAFSFRVPRTGTLNEEDVSFNLVDGSPFEYAQCRDATAPGPS